MELLNEVWNFIIDNKTASVITLLSFILAIFTLFKKPKIVKEVVREVIKVVKKTKKVIFPTAEDWFKYGEKAEKQNKIDNAIRCYKKATELKPEFAEAYRRIAYIYYYKNKEYEKSIEYFKKIIEFEPENEGDYSYIGSAYFCIFDCDNAMFFLKKAIECSQRKIDVFQNNIVECSESIEKNTKKCEKRERGECVENIDKLQKGLCDKRKKYIDLCVKAKNAALVAIEAQHKLLATIYFTKGKLYIHRRNDNEALRCFQEAVNYNANYAEAYCIMGFLHSNVILNFGKSEEYLQKAIEYGNSEIKAEANFHLGMLYRSIQQLLHNDKNIDTEILETFRSDVKVKSDDKKAIEYFKNAIKLKENYAIAYHMLGCVYHDNRNYIEAKPLFKKAIELGDKNAYDMLGKAYFRSAECSEDYDMSLYCFREHIKFNPNNINAETYFWIGSVYFAKGRYYSLVHYDEAIVYFQRAIKMKENYAEAYFNMGLAFLNKSLLNSPDTAIGIRLIQYAAKLQFAEAQSFLENNKELVSNAAKIDVSQNHKILDVLEILE